MKVCWAETAERHLDGIYAFIAQDSPTYALNIVDKLTKRSEQIADFPMSGRCVPEYGLERVREVFEGSYRIIYNIKPKQIDIIAVIHEAKEIHR
jgi:toxin ParE1/3/4